MQADALDFQRDGARFFPAVLSPAKVAQLIDVFGDDPVQAGVRLTGLAGLLPFLEIPGPVAGVAATVLGPTARPVRAVLFDKTASVNWALGWHQDRTIVVTERRDVVGFGPWSIKSGLQHVEPPFAILERMVTVRVHLDPVGPDNAALLIVPGSHRMGRIPQGDIEATAARMGSYTCLADVGDVWLYATPILHASDAARVPARRRVLQVDYSAEDLPAGLMWLGI
jgi:hypothetical protein